MKSLMYTSLVLFIALATVPQPSIAQSTDERTVLTEAEFNNATQRLQQEVINNPDKYIVVRDGQKVDVWNTDKKASKDKTAIKDDADVERKSVRSDNEAPVLIELKSDNHEVVERQKTEDVNIGKGKSDTYSNDLEDEGELEMINEQKRQAEVKKEQQKQHAIERRERIMREQSVQVIEEPIQVTQRDIDLTTEDERSEDEGSMKHKSEQNAGAGQGSGAVSGQNQQSVITKEVEGRDPLDVQAGDDANPVLKRVPIDADHKPSPEEINKLNRKNTEGSGIQQTPPSDMPDQNPNRK